MRSSKTVEPRLLLIDRNSLKQQLRATVFRNCEIAVHTTDSLSDALRLCKIQRYDMVLLAADEDSEASLICSELRKAVPRQRIALLIGPPAYLREMRAGEDGSGHRPTRPTPRLKIVELQRTQWSALMDRLLATPSSHSSNRPGHARANTEVGDRDNLKSSNKLVTIA